MYINTKTVYGVETIDEINRSDFEGYREYKNELRTVISGYYDNGINVYLSHRSTKEWKEKK
jgi:hypothetical protein